MTNDELNLYIKHYLEKDKTGRAIMLTGNWGIGKSYYIKNILAPFLSCTDNGAHQCIIVSLYGLSSLTEISKAIYFEARLKKLNPKSEVGKGLILVGRTVIKGVASACNVDLSVNEAGLQELYESIDLSGKLIILEDVERTGISILQLLGYVNNLTEQDGAKVLLVTNEDEIIQYEPLEETDAEKEEIAFLVDRVTDHKTRKYTKETQKYLEIKEKTVEDTITFTGDLRAAVKQIIPLFKNDFLNAYNNDENAEDFVDIMALMDSYNLRSFIFACQKAADIYEQIAKLGSYSDDFLKTVFYGILFFSLRLNKGKKEKWIGMDYYSTELGNNRYPLFRFCYDYITTQMINTDHLVDTVKSFENFQLYDPNKTSSDKDIQTISAFSIHTEDEVRCAVENITNRLDDINDIAFFEYGNIAVDLVMVAYYLDLDISAAKEKLITNLKGKASAINEDHLFRISTCFDDEKEVEEYNELRSRMIASLHDKAFFIPDFDYLPEQSEVLVNFAYTKDGRVLTERGFLRFLDISRLVKMYENSSPKQMNNVRDAFGRIYRVVNIKDYLADDLPSIEEFRNQIAKLADHDQFDRIQKMQCAWFVNDLTKICNKLS